MRPSGSAWSPKCTQSPSSCASGFDVLALGTLREWTASDVKSESVPRKNARLASVRGADAAAPSHFHRCAKRQAVPDDTEDPEIGFRCCSGAPNGASIVEPTLGKTFQTISIEAEALEAVLSQHPETASIAKDIVFFHEPEGARTVISRGPGDRKGFSFTVSPLRWNPVAGARYVIVAARSGDKTSFVVALHVLDAKRYDLAASFIMQDEPGPVAIAYDDYIRPRAHFSTCWGCPGETGKLLYREHDRVAIVQP